MDSLFKQYEGIFEAENAEDNSDTKKQKEKFFTYSPFALQDAVGERNVKKIWIEYQKLRLADIEAEELIHNILKKVRDMLAINLGANKEDLGIQKDFPYSKSKRDVKNWRQDELKNFYTKLVEIYHKSRMESGKDLNGALEELILSI